jgi:hypothetical protein
MTRFYALWVHHKGLLDHLAGCPKDKIVRLVRLFRRHHDIGLPDEPWTAPVIPLRVPLRRAQPQHRLRP